VALLLRTKAQLSVPVTPQLFTYDMVKEYPHDPDAFTQGLQFDSSGDTEFFWESTGVRCNLETFSKVSAILCFTRQFLSALISWHVTHLTRCVSAQECEGNRP
jgi:glutamine cyclotransferase